VALLLPSKYIYKQISKNVKKEKSKKSKSQRESPKNPKEKKRKPFVQEKNSVADIYIMLTG